MAQNKTFRKAAEYGCGISVMTVAAVTNPHLGYKFAAPIGRDLGADICGDNDVLAGFPYQKCAVGEAVMLQKDGYFEAIAQGTCHINNPFTMGTLGTVRVAVVTTDLFQGIFVTEALDGEVVTVRPK